ncbi:hypothetical protein TeGR_g4804, partial [Tetraparma gracilis]
IASMNGFQIGQKRLKVQHKRTHIASQGGGYDHGVAGEAYSYAAGGGVAGAGTEQGVYYDAGGGAVYGTADVYGGGVYAGQAGSPPKAAGGY